ncbi:MAG: hypothetical protein ACTSP9_12100 [Promethearchaeota archaeon]
MNRCIICGKEIDRFGFDDRCQKCWNDLTGGRYISLSEITDKPYMRTIPVNQRKKEKKGIKDILKDLDGAFSFKKKKKKIINR